MKFQRNARLLRNQIDIAPFAGMFFCLLIFLLLASLVYTPGVQISLPVTDYPVPGAVQPLFPVALAGNGQLYCENEPISETNLLRRLTLEKERQPAPITLVVMADKDVTLQQLNRLRDLARAAGIERLSQQVLPRVYDAPGQNGKP